MRLVGSLKLMGAKNLMIKGSPTPRLDFRHVCTLWYVLVVCRLLLESSKARLKAWSVSNSMFTLFDLPSPSYESSLRTITADVGCFTTLSFDGSAGPVVALPFLAEDLAPPLMSDWDPLPFRLLVFYLEVLFLMLLLPILRKEPDRTDAWSFKF